MPVDLVRRATGRKFSSRRLKQIGHALLQFAGQADAELSVALIGDAEMQKLNARYRQKNYATDVLSFPAAQNLPAPARLLGDVIISIDKAAAQAKQRGHSLDLEIVTLLIHGVIHLLGYDHEQSARQARLTTRLEKKMARRLCDLGLLKI